MGDSVWHILPNGSDTGKSDWFFLIMQRSIQGWVFSSGKKLTAYEYSGASNNKE